MDFLVGANRKLGDFAVGATFGGNTMDNTYQMLQESVTNFYVRGLYTIGNGQTKNPSYSYSRKKVNSLYGTLDLSFRDYLFVNLTGTLAVTLISPMILARSGNNEPPWTPTRVTVSPPARRTTRSPPSTSRKPR